MNAAASNAELPASVLVIDDDPLVSVVVERALEGVDFRLRTAYDASQGIEEVRAERPDLIVLDNVLPDGLGVDFVGRIHEAAPEAPILFVTARGSGSTAIEAMKLCAFDYLPKPLEPAKLRRQIQRALAHRRMLSGDYAGVVSRPAIDSATPPRSPEGALVGECPAMQSVFKAIGKVALLDVAVMLRGEHGTGKESIAREIHRHSSAADGPVVRLHCSGMEEARLDEELFGRATPAGQPTVGKIAEATGGTLLLQEVGRLPLLIQAKLLHAVRDGHYEPVGAKQAQRVECRIIAISSDDLESLVRSGAFRSDLYYALSSFMITLPPLRQRMSDLPLLVEHSLRKLQNIAAGFGVERPMVSEEAMRALCTHLWPGNIDELESVMKRAMVEQKGHLLLAADLQKTINVDPVVKPTEASRDAKNSTDWAEFARMRIESGVDTLHSDATEEMERKLFARVLQHTGGNQSHAARLLGITRASLRKKLRLYGMTAQQDES
ncbi:MAG: sigma-54 dependent transcriptional regulator [Planctomycetota bacterium]